MLMFMPKLPVIKYREIVNALRRNGFEEVRSKGSHLQMKKGNLLVTIPMHRKDVSQATLKSILRQARIDVEEFQKLI